MEQLIEMTSGKPVLTKTETRSISLWETEGYLAALIDTEGADLSPELEAEYRQECELALRTAVDKRESVGRFILACEAAQEACKKESQRIAKRGRQLGALADRVRGWVLAWIEEQPVETSGRRKGMLPHLKGHTVTMRAQAIAAQLQITDFDKVPEKFKSVAITMTAEEWRHLKDAAGGYLPERFKDNSAVTYSIQEPAAKAFLAGWDGEGESPVPGAELVVGRHTLVVV